MLAAFDPDSLLKLVVLVLLGSGGLVKSFLERKRAREAGGGESVSRRRRAETQRRLAELEEEIAKGREELEGMLG